MSPKKIVFGKELEDELIEVFGRENVRRRGESRQKRHFDDEDERTPRQKKQGAHWRRPSPTTPPPTTPPIEIIEKKEKTVNTPTTPPATKPATTQTTSPKPQTFNSIKELRAAYPRQEDNLEPCPVCGWRKPKKIDVRGVTGGIRPLVCKACSDKYHQYGAEIATKLAKGEKVAILTRHAWVLNQLDLAKFIVELHEAFVEKGRLDEVVQQKLDEKRKEVGGFLPPEVFNPLREKFQEEVGGKSAYGKWRRMQARLAAATEVRPQVEKMVADEAAKNAPPATTPPVPATPPPTTPEPTTATPSTTAPAARKPKNKKVA